MRGLRPQEVSCWLRRRGELGERTRARCHISSHLQSLLLLPSQARQFLLLGMHFWASSFSWPAVSSGGRRRRALDFGSCWLLLLFLPVALFAAVMPRSLLVVMIVLSGSSSGEMHLHLHLHLRCAISLYPYIFDNTCSQVVRQKSSARCPR